MHRVHLWDARFYFRHRGRFIRLRARDDALQVKVRSGPWENSTPAMLAELLAGKQLAHVFENSRNKAEKRMMLQALSLKFGVAIATNAV